MWSVSMGSPVPLMGVLPGYRRGTSGISQSDFALYFTLHSLSTWTELHVLWHVPLSGWEAEIHTILVPEGSYLSVSFWAVFWTSLMELPVAEFHPGKAEYKWLLSACAYTSQGQTFWPSSVSQIEMAAHFPQFSLKILPKCIETITLFCQSSPPLFSATPLNNGLFWVPGSFPLPFLTISMKSFSWSSFLAFFMSQEKVAACVQKFVMNKMKAS